MERMKKTAAAVVLVAMFIMLMGSLQASEIRPLALNSGAASMRIGKMTNAGFFSSDGLAAEVYYSSQWQGSDLSEGGTVILPKGHFTFCVEPDKALVSSSGNEVSGSVGEKNFLKKLTTARIPQEGKIFEILGKVLAVAGPDETSGAALCSNAPEGTKYLAAQLIIWQIVYGDMNAEFELLGDIWKKKGFESMSYWQNAPAGGRSIRSWYDEWVGKLKKADKLPSFVTAVEEEPYQMQGDTLRLTDQNGVLSYMRLTASEESVSLQVEGNNLIIQNPEHKDFTVTVENQICAGAKEPAPIMAYDTTAGTGTQNSRQTNIITSAVNLAVPVQGSFRIMAAGGTVEVDKVDAGEAGMKLSGAVFGVYRDEAGTALLVTMPPTDADGISRVEMEAGMDLVYLKEITAPDGYQLNETIYPVSLTPGKISQITISDQQQKGRLVIYKEGEAVTGVQAEEEGLRFIFDKRYLVGAAFALHAAEDIVDAGGHIIYAKGALIQDNLITGVDGSVSVDELPLGVYEVREKSAPEGYVTSRDSQRVTLSYAGQEAELSVNMTSVWNERQKAVLQVVKQDADTKFGLKGAVFGLFADKDIVSANGEVLAPAGQLIEKAVTEADGTLTFEADLPFGSYCVKELAAPKGYVRSEETYVFTFDAKKEGPAQQEFSHTFANERMQGSIRIVKEDVQTGEVPQGDATLVGAVYGLYAREDIVYPDGKSGIVYPAGTQIATMVINEEREASVDGLYLGKYYVKELVPPVGYTLDETEYDFTYADEKELSAVIRKTITVKEKVKRQAFQLIKVGHNGKTEDVPLQGAGFTAYLLSSLHQKEDGSYDFEKATPVILTESGETELFSDEKGYACSIPLPFGTYIVRETTVPQNYKPVDDFIVQITENKPDEPQAWRVFIYEAISAKLKIIKSDVNSKEVILKAGTEFRIFDLDTEEYVTQETVYPATELHESFMTNEEGFLILPQPLPAGHYQVEEVAPPEGYIIGETVYEFYIQSNSMYQVEENSEEAIVEINVENEAAKGCLMIIKEGASSVDENGVMELESLPGAMFAVYTAEDIYTPDYQVDAKGKRRVLLAKDTLMGVLTTDENGEAVLKDLPLGCYYVEELKAPDGYVKNEEREEFELVYVDQDTTEIVTVLRIFNEKEVPPTVTSPVETGDETHVWPYLVGMGVGIFTLIMTFLVGRSRRKKEG